MDPVTCVKCRQENETSEEHVYFRRGKGKFLFSVMIKEISISIYSCLKAYEYSLVTSKALRKVIVKYVLR